MELKGTRATGFYFLVDITRDIVDTLLEKAGNRSFYNLTPSLPNKDELLQAERAISTKQINDTRLKPGAWKPGCSRLLNNNISHHF